MLAQTASHGGGIALHCSNICCCWENTYPRTLAITWRIASNQTRRFAPPLKICAFVCCRFHRSGIRTHAHVSLQQSLLLDWRLCRVQSRNQCCFLGADRQIMPTYNDQVQRLHVFYESGQSNCRHNPPSGKCSQRRGVLRRGVERLRCFGMALTTSSSQKRKLAVTSPFTCQSRAHSNHMLNSTHAKLESEGAPD